MARSVFFAFQATMTQNVTCSLHFAFTWLYRLFESVGAACAKLTYCPAQNLRQGLTPPLSLAHLDVEYLPLVHGIGDGVHLVGKVALGLPLHTTSPDPD